MTRGGRADERGEQTEGARRQKGASRPTFSPQGAARRRDEKVPIPLFSCVSQPIHTIARKINLGEWRHVKHARCMTQRVSCLLFCRHKELAEKQEIAGLMERVLPYRRASEAADKTKEQKAVCEPLEQVGSNPVRELARQPENDFVETARCWP